MLKWELLEQVKTPDGSLMTLHSNGIDRVIRVNGRELMSTRHHHSEEQLAVVGCAAFKTKSTARVLIGGLGLGFTLRSALANLHSEAAVVVAELIPEVLQWNAKPAYDLGYDCMADGRTQLVIRDVGEVIYRESGGFDAILLDTDNGTTAMSTEANESLYKAKGLQQVRAALRPGGNVVYWSAAVEPVFAKLMAKNGFTVEVQRPRIHPNSGARHTLVIGRKR